MRVGQRVRVVIACVLAAPLLANHARGGIELLARHVHPGPAALGARLLQPGVVAQRQLGPVALAHLDLTPQRRAPFGVLLPPPPPPPASHAPGAAPRTIPESGGG